LNSGYRQVTNHENKHEQSTPIEREQSAYLLVSWYEYWRYSSSPNKSRKLSYILRNMNRNATLTV